MISGFSNSQEYWKKYQTPVDLKLNTIFCLDTTNIWIAADSGKILYTSDKGENWIEYQTGRPENLIKLFFLDENHGWGLAHYENFPDYKTIIFKTTDGGQTWEDDYYRIENVFLYSIVFFDTLNGWVGGDTELAYTEDGGQNWYKPPLIDSTFIYLPIYEIKFANPKIGYAVGGYIDFVGVVWSTSDSGKSWNSQLVTADPAYDIHIFDEQNAYALSSDIEHNYNIEVLKTSNGGIDWTVEILSVYGTVSAIDFRTDSEGWATMGRDRLAMNSFDGGRSWEYYTMPDSMAVNDVQFLDSLNGFMVGDSGSFFKYIPNDPVNIIDVSDLLNPNSFFLFQNYPNPFNSQTKIRYLVSELSYAKLSLINTLGEEVKVIDEGWKNTGEYNINIDVNDIAAGVYLYQLKVNNSSGLQSQIKKMVLLK